MQAAEDEAGTSTSVSKGSGKSQIQGLLGLFKPKAHLLECTSYKVILSNSSQRVPMPDGYEPMWTLLIQPTDKYNKFFSHEKCKKSFKRKVNAKG